MKQIENKLSQNKTTTLAPPSLAFDNLISH